MIPSLQRSSLLDIYPLKIYAEVASSVWCAYSTNFLSKGVAELADKPSKAECSRSHSCFLTSSSVAASGAQIYKIKIFVVILDCK